MAHWELVIKRLQKLKADLPTIVGNEMVNYSLDNIRDQKDIQGKPLKPRRPDAPRNTGRHILVDRGRGRRSIKAKRSGDKVRLTAEDYMVAHNEGVDKTVTARSRKGKSYSRKMKLPKRQITGESNAQTSRINKVVTNLIIKAAS